ncbi:MAG: type II toxin-antitoxin system VapC family toxin [Desulfobacteraceae bacterium]|nr:MAG: type II toxin-antitoxin system VapC family toxin [Desulfobacteraceae bacterium]
MIYMLDTDTCIYTIKKNPPEVFEHLRKFSPDSIGVSAITEAELRFGMSNSSKPEHNHRVLDEFLAPFQIVPFDSAAASHYGEIRAHLRRNGTLIGNMDLLIAAHARSLSVTLVTNNIKEFKKVPGLQVDNWSS